MAARNLGAFALFLLSMTLVPTAMSEVTGADGEIDISAIVVLELAPILDDVDYYDILRFTYSSSITTDDGRPWCHLKRMRISHACDLPDYASEYAGLGLGFSSSSDNEHYDSFPAGSFECELTDLSDEYWRLNVVEIQYHTSPNQPVSPEFFYKDEYELILTKDSLLKQTPSSFDSNSRVISYSGRTYVDRKPFGGELSVEDHRPLAKQRVQDSDVGVLTLECPYIRFPLVGR